MPRSRRRQMPGPAGRARTAARTNARIRKASGPGRRGGRTRRQGRRCLQRTAITRASVISWRTRRPRLAPSDTRSAISVRRDSPRASSRLARLAHAISSSTPTPTSSAVSESENSRRVDEAPRSADWSFSRSSRKLAPLGRVGVFPLKAARLAWRMALACASASAPLTPGFSRPKTCSHIDLFGGVSCRRSVPGNTRGCSRIGSQKSGCWPLVSPMKPWGVDADHGHGGIAHLERLAQRVELAPEAPAPVRVADDGVRHLVPVVRRGEQPANGRPDPEHFEEPTGHEPPTALFPAIPLETDLPGAEAALTGHQRREPIGLVPQLLELCVGHPRARSVGAPVPAAGPTASLVGVGQHHQLARMRHHRQRRVQHAIPQLEDGGIGADAERQRQQRRRGESRPRRHRAQRVAQVLLHHVPVLRRSDLHRVDDGARPEDRLGTPASAPSGVLAAARRT